MITFDFGIGISIGAIIGFILREIIGDRLARSRNLETIHNAEFNKASTEFKEAFLPVYMALNPAQFALKEDLSVFLNAHFHDLRRAVFKFYDVLDAKTKPCFLQAWHEYCCHKDQRNENGVPFFEQYSCRELTIKQEHEMKKLARCRIQKILEFAKPK